MGKILLCGNGLNIKFEDKFKLKEFIDLLVDEKRLREFFNESINFFKPKDMKIDTVTISTFGTFNISDYHKKIENFCWIIKKCHKEIIESKNDFSKSGVEFAFKQLFEKVEEYLSFDENDNLYEEFESSFKELFFSYLWKLQNQSSWEIIKNFKSSSPGFKNKLEDYMKIITLNYDTILEDVLKVDKRNIIHWHGTVKEKQDGSLDFSSCLLDSVRNPKSLQSFKQIPLFKNYQKYKARFELDILGLNPMNDENVFALFINSQICHKINFYYHSKDDLNNLTIILKKIQNLWLEINKNKKIELKKLSSFQRFDFVEEKDKEKYVIKFYNKEVFVKNKESDFVEINLILSKVFWEKCKIVPSKIAGPYEEIFNDF
ncbi:MAG: hypothetical protein ACRC8P_03320 [Spiroplasma sp.]